MRPFYWIVPVAVIAVVGAIWLGGEKTGDAHSDRDRPSVGGGRHRSGRALPAIGSRTRDGDSDGDPVASAGIGTGGAIEVILTSPDGTAVAGARVTLMDGRRNRPARTDGLGRVDWAPIPAGSYALTVDASDRPRLTSAIRIELEDGEYRRLEITAPLFDRAITGQVLDPAGEPVERMVVVAARQILGLEHELRELDDPSVVTDSSGAFRFANLADGPYELRTVETKSYPSASVLTSGGDSGVAIVVAKNEWIHVEGVVKDEDGFPLAGVEISALGSPKQSSKTDDSGRYSLELAFAANAPRQRTLRFEHEGYEPKSHVVAFDAEAVSQGFFLHAELRVLRNSATLSGTIVTPTGAPAFGQQIRIASSSRRFQARAVAGVRGEFEFRAVPYAEDYHVWVQPRRMFRDFTTRDFVIASPHVELPIALEEVGYGRLVGRVIDVEGNPVPQVKLTATSDAAAEQGRAFVARTDGSFEVDGVPAGSIVFESPSPPTVISGIDLDAEQVREVFLVVDRGERTLFGTAVTESGQPLAGGNVLLLWTYTDEVVSSSSRRRTVTNARGEFRFSHLGPGEHRLQVSAKGFETAELSPNLPRGEYEVEIELIRKSE